MLFVFAGVVGPTSFDSSMFPSHGAEATDSPVASGGGEDSHGGSKSHKAKKKKKKNKHKHKHKHKHDRGDREKLKLDKNLLSGIILEHPLSSDASNANSPMVHLSPEGPSSPEFEVI